MYGTLVLTRISVKATSWNNNLDTLGVIGVWNCVVHQADSSDDFSCWHKSILGCVGWITNDDWSSGDVFPNSDSSDLSFRIESDFIRIGIEHISTTMDSTES